MNDRTDMDLEEAMQYVNRSCHDEWITSHNIDGNFAIDENITIRDAGGHGIGFGAPINDNKAFGCDWYITHPYGNHHVLTKLETSYYIQYAVDASKDLPFNVQASYGHNIMTIAPSVSISFSGISVGVNFSPGYQEYHGSPLLVEIKGTTK